MLNRDDEHDDDDIDPEELEDPEEHARVLSTENESSNGSGNEDEDSEVDEGSGGTASENDPSDEEGGFDEDEDGVAQDDSDIEDAALDDTSNINTTSTPFATQNSGKVRRILRNLLSNLSSDRKKAYREANKFIYLDICSILAIEVDATMSKSELHDVILLKVYMADRFVDTHDTDYVHWHNLD